MTDCLTVVASRVPVEAAMLYKKGAGLCVNVRCIQIAWTRLG